MQQNTISGRSTVTGNRAADGGGLFFSGSGPVLIQDSTFSGNCSVTGSGSGLDVVASGGFTMKGSTVTGNTAIASSGGSDSYGEGGGILLTLTGSSSYIGDNTTISQHYRNWAAEWRSLPAGAKCSSRTAPSSTIAASREEVSTCPTAARQRSRPARSPETSPARAAANLVDTHGAGRHEYSKQHHFRQFRRLGRGPRR